MENTTDLNQLILNSSTTQKIDENIVIPALLYLFGSGGNILAIVLLFVSSQRHKWKPFYRLVFALALTDLTGNFLVYPFIMMRYASDFTYEYSNSVCQHVAFMFSLCFLGSALLVMMMSFDRFLAILFPFVYNTPKKILRTHIFIIICWSIPAIVCILPLAGIGRVKIFYPGSWCFIDFTSHVGHDEAIAYIYAILGLIIFILTLLFNAAVIFAICHRMYVNRKNLGSQKRIKSDIYVISFLLAIVTVFSVCWMPLMTFIIKIINDPNPKTGKQGLLVIRLAISNSNIDPWIYIVLRKENLEFVERLFKRYVMRSEEPSQPSSTGTSKQGNVTLELSTENREGIDPDILKKTII